MAAPVRSFHADSLAVRVFANANDLSLAAATEVRDFLRDAIAQRGGARVILATGNSQLKFLDDLARLGSVDWSRITCFHMDEYLGIAGDHPASFVRYMRERVETRVKPGRFHYLRGDAPDVAGECDRFAALLREAPIDVCCLGVGENGHLAFNDPPVADFNDAAWVKVVPLDETNRKQQAGYGHFKSLEDVPKSGITLTIPALVAARKVLCLAPGASKASIIRRTLREAIGAACPASILRTQAQAVLLLDADSAGLV